MLTTNLKIIQTANLKNMKIFLIEKYSTIIKIFQKAVKPNRWFESKKMNN